jgi:hypothetical protein
MGVMVSAFQSREFGWGMEIDDDQLAVINARRLGNDYFDAAWRSTEHQRNHH